jgi:dynamin 1-like protein
MQRIIQHCGTEVQQEMLRFPKLHKKIFDVVTQLLRHRFPTTNVIVEHMVTIELAYINTKHPDFHKEAALVSSMWMNEQIDPWSNHTPSKSSNTSPSQSLAPNPGSADSESSNHSNHVGENSSWLSNILPPPRHKSTDSSQSNTPMHIVMSPIKPVNILPDVPINQGARRLTDKEQRDCDIIERLVRSYF